MAVKKQTLPTGRVQAVEVKPKSSPTVALADKLAGLSNKKSKAKTPVLDITEPVAGIVDRIRALHDDMEHAKEKYTEATEELIASVQPKYREHLRKVAYVSSVNVTNSREDLLVTWRAAYSAIPLEVRKEIEEVIGKEKFDLWFSTSASINITTAKPDIIEKVMDLLQKSGLMEYFKVEGFIEPSAKFTQERFRAFTAEQNGKLDPLVKQYKPSVRVG